MKIKQIDITVEVRDGEVFVAGKGQTALIKLVATVVVQRIAKATKEGAVKITMVPTNAKAKVEGLMR